jgi:hypothetical protein
MMDGGEAHDIDCEAQIFFRPHIPLPLELNVRVQAEIVNSLRVSLSLNLSSVGDSRSNPARAHAAHVAQDASPPSELPWKYTHSIIPSSWALYGEQPRNL